MRVRISLTITALILAIMGSALAQTGYWSEPIPVPELNDPSGEGYPFISTDGTIMLLITRGGISMSHSNGSSWETPVLLPPTINSPDGLERASAITPDHRFIYWVSWRPGGHGGWDIWRCTWDEGTNTFGAAECLGENVNSEYYEWGMCFTPDGQRMYFLSNAYYKNGQYGHGDMDVWYCDWDSSLGDWGLPYNIGNPVNAMSLEDTPHINMINVGNMPRLYFCSDWGHGVPGWLGELDIFYATWDSQHWGNVTNVGAPINSPVEDESPCLAPDGRTMYFITRENRVPYAIKHIMVSHWEISGIDEYSDSESQKQLKIGIYPNPSNSRFVFALSSNHKSGMMKIYDIYGHLVYKSPIDLNRSGIIWDTSDKNSQVPSGVYFARFEFGDGAITKKLVLLK
jgi:hypothetical protein